jgi:CheY-like chemotaxis protein
VKNYAYSIQGIECSLPGRHSHLEGSGVAALAGRERRNPRFFGYHMGQKTKRILIADDNAHLRKALCRLFEDHDYLEICCEAANGREAVEKAIAVKPDLIILDLSMPVMNGLEAARLLTALMPHVPKILFTLHAHALIKSDLDAAGIDRVVSKSDMLDLISHSEFLTKAA